MVEFFPTVDEAGRFLSSKVRTNLAGQFAGKGVEDVVNSGRLAEASLAGIFETKTNVASRYATKGDLAEVVTGEPVALTDAAVAGALAAPGSAAANVLDRAYAAGVNVTAHGVNIDGTAPTGPALVAAMNAAVSLRLPLRLPRGRYVLSNVPIPSGLTIEGVGPETVVVQGSADKPSLFGQGTLTRLGALTGTLRRGDTTVTTTLGAALTPGDLLLVTDAASFAATDPTYKSGEMLVVRSATTSAITLARPVRGSRAAADEYTVANGAELYKVTPARNITLRNLAFEGHGTGSTQLVKFYYAAGVRMENVTTTTAQAGFLYVDTCYDVDLTNVGLHGLVDNHATGRPGYGIILRHACLDVRISNVVCTQARHAITTIGGPYGEPRNVTISGVQSDDRTSTAVVDTHSAGEGILITGCQLRGSSFGVTVRARNVTVVGNDIQATTAAGVVVTEDAKNVVIKGNRFRRCVGYGVKVGQGGSVHENVEVSENTFDETVGGAGVPIFADAGMTRLRIVRNTIHRAGGSGIDVNIGSADVLIADNLVTDAALSGNPIAIQAHTGTTTPGAFDIIGNVVRNISGTPGRAVRSTRTTGRMIGNRAFGTYVSAGTEFHAPGGMTAVDNVLYP